MTLPQHFQDNGYVSRGIGKIFHGGYNDVKSWSAPWEGAKAHNFGPDGQKLLAKLRFEAKTKGADVSRVRGLPVEAPEVADDYLNDGALANRGCELLRELKGQPFFLAVGFAKPHLPFVAPKKYWDLYDPAKLLVSDDTSSPKGAPAFAPTNFGELRAYHGVPKTGPVPPELARKLVHGYYAAVSYMDAMVGRLLDELDKQGLTEDTVVVLWGDHGWHLGDHGMWCKHTNYEKATRSALVLAKPGQKAAGKKTDALVEFVDIYPTLAEACGLKLPSGLEGHSFTPLLDDPARPWKPAALSQYPRGGKETGPLMGYAIRTDRYRLVEWRERKSGQAVAHELYDHTTDPGEGRNIADRLENREVIGRLKAQLARGWKGSAPPH